MEWALAIVALALLGVGAISRRLSGTPVTAAMLFVALGLLVGPQVLDGIDLESTSSTVRTLAEATLAVVLFSDASRIDLRQLRPDAGVPLRLLGIGLPLTIGLGALAAAVIFDQMTVGEAVILGVILAPTDAALGQAVVTEPRVPARIRQGLNVESGLNDGICVPLLFAAVAAADVESEIAGGRSAGTLLVEEIGFGVIGGVIAGLAIGAIFIYAGNRGLISDTWRRVIPAAGAALAYGIASGLGGSGFIAAFVGGMVFRAVLRRAPAELNQLNEEVGEALNGVTFLLFGAILLGTRPRPRQLESPPLRGPQPHDRADAPGGDRDARLARAPADAGLPRLVRAPWARLDRLCADHRRGVTAPAGGDDPARDLLDRGAVGVRPRAHRGAARRPLRPLVPSSPARLDGGWPGRRDESARIPQCGR